MKNTDTLIIVNIVLYSVTFGFIGHNLAKLITKLEPIPKFSDIMCKMCFLVPNSDQDIIWGNSSQQSELAGPLWCKNVV